MPTKRSLPKPPPDRKPPKKKTGKIGRPGYDIDIDQVAKLASIGATIEELANWFGVDISYIEKNKEIIRVYKKNKDGFRMSLRREQYQVAKKGNATMLIWLGKQVLGQRDQPVDLHGSIKEIRARLLLVEAEATFDDNED